MFLYTKILLRKETAFILSNIRAREDMVVISRFVFMLSVAGLSETVIVAMSVVIVLLAVITVSVVVIVVCVRRRRRTAAGTERFLLVYLHCFAVPSVFWRCWLGGRKGVRPVKNWVVRCWRGYLSGARCISWAICKSVRRCELEHFDVLYLVSGIIFFCFSRSAYFFCGSNCLYLAR